MASHEAHIRRCLELALKGEQSVGSNPVVGCVLVKDDQVIGEGYHEVYGGPHAEVNAVASVANPSDLEGATAYVSMEPCSHHGKTPPCSDLLIKHKIARVVLSVVDPTDKVSGIEQLRAAGIEVITGILEEEGRAINKRFLTYHEKQRPYVILKWAESSDGFIAPENQARGESYWISNVRSRTMSHSWRARESAILVGKNTVVNDNPSLTTRMVNGANPLRVILDSRLTTLEGGYKVYEEDEGTDTLVFNEQRNEYLDGMTLIKSDMSIESILRSLHALKVQSILVEGGSAVLQSFIESDLWDEARVFTGISRLKTGVAAPELPGARLVSTEKIGNDELNSYSHD